ncbi:FAD-dependent oxidoreductase [Nonomuraea angiospora]|uniref:FAD-dependent oxidoreductase n=1 Tax=Nonomuraea angiospora TaxID=46172 RepID=UPI00342B2956
MVEVRCRLPSSGRYFRGRFAAAGGTVELRSPSVFKDVQPAAAIVNCAGLASRSLVLDPQLRPVRGQHLVVTNPGIVEFFSEDTGGSPDLLCIYPHGDAVVLGGTAVDGDDRLEDDDQAAEAILARCVDRTATCGCVPPATRCG